jgi:hypothetical protein
MPILFSFIPVNVTLLLFSLQTCTTTNTTTTTTDDENTNRTVWCSLIFFSFSLSRSLACSLSYPSYHMGFSFSLFSAVFFCPVRSLAFICPDHSGWRQRIKLHEHLTINKPEKRERERERRKKLSWRQQYNLYEKKKNVKILAFDQLYTVLSGTGLYDKREKNAKRIYRA